MKQHISTYLPLDILKEWTDAFSAEFFAEAHVVVTFVSGQTAQSSGEMWETYSPTIVSHLYFAFGCSSGTILVAESSTNLAIN